MEKNEAFFSSRFKPSDNIHELPPEHCSANLDQLKRIGRDLYQQVRLELPTPNGEIPAIYTVGKVHEEELDLVYVGNKIEKYVTCLQHNTDPCKGKVKAVLTNELSEDDARSHGEFIEQLTDDGQNQKLIVIAPHGGEIETKTDKQAENVRHEISSDDVSLWICKGFDQQDKSAFERWHITSTQISEKSFPMLSKIYQRKFRYAIAFHGWTRGNICVGGIKDNETVTKLKVEIADAIQSAIKKEGSDIQVKVSGCPECLGAFNGDNPDNIVNRLGTNGIQIEQCKLARQNFHGVIAKAVAKVIQPYLSIPN